MPSLHKVELHNNCTESMFQRSCSLFRTSSFHLTSLKIRAEKYSSLVLVEYYFFVYQDITLILKADLKLVEKSYSALLVPT